MSISYLQILYKNIVYCISFDFNDEYLFKHHFTHLFSCSNIHLNMVFQRFQRSLKPEFSWKPPHYSQEQNDSMENEEEDMDNLTLSEYIEN